MQTTTAKSSRKASLDALAWLGLHLSGGRYPPASPARSISACGFAYRLDAAAPLVELLPLANLTPAGRSHMTHCVLFMHP
jgi:hypothetical protein